MAILKPGDFAAIKDNVTEIEKRTRGEIVPLILPNASNYGWVRDRLALLGVFLALIGGEAWSLVRAWPLDALELSLLVLGGALFGAGFGMIPVVIRLVAGRGRLDYEVHRRAQSEFMNQGCANTREASGILVMVALLEHRIEILADRGIQKAAVEKEGPDVWSKITSSFAASARDGKAVEGMGEVIRRLGEILARHFPVAGMNDNELSDHVRTEK